jgi:hypothetical protein
VFEDRDELVLTWLRVLQGEGYKRVGEGSGPRRETRGSSSLFARETLGSTWL